MYIQPIERDDPALKDKATAPFPLNRADTGTRGVKASCTGAWINWLTGYGVLGSGGNLRPDLLLPDLTTGGVVIVFGAATEPSPQLVGISDKLVDIQATLGLSIKQVAVVMRVSRPTIYGWLEGQVPREEAITRIDAIHSLVQYWKALCSESPIKYLAQEIENGKSLLDLLSASRIEAPAIKQAMRVLSRKLLEDALQREENSIAYRMRKLGAKPQTPEEVAMVAGQAQTAYFNDEH